MATAGSLLGDVRVHFGDPDRDFITDAIGMEWLDVAQQRFCDEVMALDEIQDFTLATGVSLNDVKINVGAGRTITFS